MNTPSVTATGVIPASSISPDAQAPDQEENKVNHPASTAANALVHIEQSAQPTAGASSQVAISAFGKLANTLIGIASLGDRKTSAEHYTELQIRIDDAGCLVFAKAFLQETAPRQGHSTGNGNRISELVKNLRQDLKTASSDTGPTDAEIIDDLAKQLVPFVKAWTSDLRPYDIVRTRLDKKLEELAANYHRMIFAAKN